MSNPQLISRDGQTLTLDMNKLVLVSDLGELDALKEAGYHFVKMVGANGTDVVWRSKVPDGYTRTVNSNWTSETLIYPYETDMLVWSNNVKEWFRYAKLDPRYYELTADAKSFHGVELSTDELFSRAANYMAGQKPSRMGRIGKRVANIDTWFRKGKNSYISKMKGIRME